VHNFMLAHDSGFALSEEERGSFRTDVFPPVDFPVVPYTSWVERNFPIPPGIYEDVYVRATLTVWGSSSHSILIRGNPK
jgi:hypothetical protein